MVNDWTTLQITREIVHLNACRNSPTHLHQYAVAEFIPNSAIIHTPSLISEQP